jgi:hypothetical protein
MIGAEPLVAIIGAGESTRAVPDGFDLLMSAAGSYDPDAAVRLLLSKPDLTGNRLSYSWTCEVSPFSNMTSSTSCDTNLMPPNSTDTLEFVVPSASLVSATSTRESDAGYAYIRYGLSISVDDQYASTYQDIWVYSGTSDVQYTGIMVTNGGGGEIDPKAIPFWEEVIIRPVVAQPQDGSSGSAWTFDLLSPRQLRLSLFGGKSLLSEPGYYLPSGPSINQYQSAPLGIRAGVLLPHQEYIFSMTFLSQGASGQGNQTLATFSLVTVEKPNILFPPVLTPNVTVNDIIRANAYVDVDNDQMFQYQFYLINLDGQTGSANEYCVDGCTGASEVRFSVFRPGSYTLQARLFAANGKAVLDYADNDATIVAIDDTVAFTSGVQLVRASNYHSSMVYDFMLGNDGAFNQRAFWVTKSMFETSFGSPVDEDTSCTETMSKWVNMTESIVSKELPITTNMRNYIDIAANYARLPCIEEDETTLYRLLHIVVLVLGLSPPENTLQMNLNTVDLQIDPSVPQAPNMDVVTSLQAFYNYSISRALNSVAGHSTRSRLQPVSNAVNNLVIDLFEQWREHLTTVSASAQVCGWSRTIRSDVIDGYAEYDLVPALSGGDPPLGLSQITVAVRCGPENGMFIDGAFSRFEWCQSAYTANGNWSAASRMLVSLAEMTDYVYLSGIQGSNKTDTKRLVAIDISTLGTKNSLVTAPRVPGVVTKSISGRNASTLCYTLGTEMVPLGASSLNKQTAQVPIQTPSPSPQHSGNSSADLLAVYTAKPFCLWPLKKYGTAFSNPFEGDAYARHSADVFAVDDTALTNYSYITMTTSRFGLFGAVHQRAALTSVTWSQDITGLAVSLLIIILVVSLLLIAMTVLIYFLASTVLNANAEELDPAENFIDRDYFGRGQIRLKDVTAMSDAESESGSSEEK